MAELINEAGDAKGVLLNNFEPEYKGISLVHAGIATCSAPGYFRSHTIPGYGKFVDGGIV